jgi:hypothetical protein
MTPSGKSCGGTPEVVRTRKVRAATQVAVVTEQRLTAFRFLFLSSLRGANDSARDPIVMKPVTTTGFI